MRTALPLALALLLLATVFAGCSEPPPPAASGPNCDKDRADVTLTNAANPLARWETSKGCILVELYEHSVPITAGNFANLTGSGFYDGTRFHRVIDDFMIQDGDPKSKDTAQRSAWGTGGPGYTIADEFPCKDGTMQSAVPSTCTGHGGLLYVFDKKGILAMANTGSVHTGGSQYFLTLGQPHHLDGRHTIFGLVVAGMEVVDAIGDVPTNTGDQPTQDVVIRDLAILEA